MTRNVFSRAYDSDIFYSFSRSPTAIISAIIALAICLGALFAPIISPHSPFDLATLDLLAANIPPAWSSAGDPRFLLGTDDQGRAKIGRASWRERVCQYV